VITSPTPAPPSPHGEGGEFKDKIYCCKNIIFTLNLLKQTPRFEERGPGGEVCTIYKKYLTYISYLAK